MVPESGAKMESSLRSGHDLWRRQVYRSAIVNKADSRGMPGPAGFGKGGHQVRVGRALSRTGGLMRG